MVFMVEAGMTSEKSVTELSNPPKCVATPHSSFTLTTATVRKGPSCTGLRESALFSVSSSSASTTEKERERDKGVGQAGNHDNHTQT